MMLLISLHVATNIALPRTNGLLHGPTIHTDNIFDVTATNEPHIMLSCSDDRTVCGCVDVWTLCMYVYDYVELCCAGHAMLGCAGLCLCYAILYSSTCACMLSYVAKCIHLFYADRVIIFLCVLMHVCMRNVYITHYHVSPTCDIDLSL